MRARPIGEATKNQDLFRLAGVSEFGFSPASQPSWHLRCFPHKIKKTLHPRRQQAGGGEDVDGHGVCRPVGQDAGQSVGGVRRQDDDAQPRHGEALQQAEAVGAVGRGNGDGFAVPVA